MINTDSEGDTVTRGVLFAEVKVCDSNREKNEEIIQTHEIVSDLEADEVKKVANVLNKYKDLIARNLRQIGCINLAQMKLTLKDVQQVVY